MVIYPLLRQLADLDITDLPRANVQQGVAVDHVLNLVFFISGALAIISLIIAGISYITSQGNPQQTAKAKNGIVFSLIGLAIVILATAIVNFVVIRAG